MHESHGTILNIFLNLLPESAHHYVDELVINSWAVIVLLVVLAWVGTRKRLRVPRGLQTVWEMYYTFVRDFCVSEIGPGAEKYVPLLGTLFLYILVLNLFGLVPGFLTPTMSLNMTIPLALMVFMSVQYFGFREQGIGYLKHFTGGLWPAPAHVWPQILWLWPMIGLMAVIHTIGEVAKPLSLSVRLFGNMFGEETALVRMAALGVIVFSATYVPLPVQFINIILHLIIGPIQAFIFFLLSAAYIQSATMHEGEDHEGSEASQAPQTAAA